MPLLHPDAAGIDIGHREHWCAVPADRCEQPVRSFGTFTQDLEEMARWLKERGIKTVAMESTGVYWIPAFQILERHGFEVCLVNARHVKNVSGRKTDIQDCQWLQRLHSFGLLNASFRPPDHICVLRSYLRYRDDLVDVVCEAVKEGLVNHLIISSPLESAIARDLVAKKIVPESDAKRPAGADPD